jgi:hypothetical protein
VQAHFMILKGSLELNKKNIVELFKIQNGGKIQDGRQTKKCSRFFKNNANNFNLQILED